MVRQFLLGRDFLDARGAGLVQHSSRRVLMTHAHNLKGCEHGSSTFLHPDPKVLHKVYEEPEDRDAAIEIVTDIIAQGRRNKLVASRHHETVSLSNLTSSSQECPSNTQVHTDRVAHNVAMRLKDNDRKFSGELGES